MFTSVLGLADRCAVCFPWLESGPRTHPVTIMRRKTQETKEVHMLETLKRGWWLVVLRGVVAVLFGVLAFAYPGRAGEVLVLLFGAYALVNGLFTLGLGIRAPKGIPGKGSLVVLGLLGVVAGILTFFYPGITALSILWVIAFWAILTGIFEISNAIKLRKELSNEWMLI